MLMLSALPRAADADTLMPPRCHALLRLILRC